ncbi:hypothetical protein QBC46DRAFT_408134 [Diplogelasinospora grovesii]|uniref:Uncharacterized protein n=1 Tax=Diplogelasinospora grovesii TaxID=303347 RepID=A0AAN6S5C6_9PEZI|nr:hypothetical protein QBC46DRAFT_408134 [Diplogelasinospora grovesii]
MAYSGDCTNSASNMPAATKCSSGIHAARTTASRVWSSYETITKFKTNEAYALWFGLPQLFIPQTPHMLRVTVLLALRRLWLLALPAGIVLKVRGFSWFMSVALPLTAIDLWPRVRSCRTNGHGPRRSAN